LAVAGFLLGGVYTCWKQASRIAATVLGVLALLAPAAPSPVHVD